MRRARVVLPALVAGLALAGLLAAERTEQPLTEESWLMTRDAQLPGVGPDKSPELSRFAFLIGQWRCEAHLRRDDGGRETLKASWEGRYILDGHIIADEYRMWAPDGDLLVLGLNFRVYDSENKTWNMKWLNALTGTWLDLGPEELGGVQVDEKAITYTMKEPLAAHAFTRATYTSLSEDHFTWRGEGSDDQESWAEFLVVECYRDGD